MGDTNKTPARGTALNRPTAMRNARGQFVAVTHTVLRDGNRGRRSRKLSLNRHQVRIKRKPHGTHLSGKPRTI